MPPPPQPNRVGVRIQSELISAHEVRPSAARENTSIVGVNGTLRASSTSSASDRQPEFAPPGAASVPQCSGGEPELPSSWKRVPSKSRPGQFSYQHLPTGLKQTRFPTSEPSSEEVAAHYGALRQAHSGRPDAGPATGKRVREVKPLLQSETTAGWQAFSARNKKRK